MKYLILLFFITLLSSGTEAQNAYDSITISRFLIKENLYTADWKDSLKAAVFPNYLSEEKTVWIKPVKVPKVLHRVLSITNRIRTNGTADVSKCFIPRHSMNFYRRGKIVRYLLVCFECDGVRFSDDPAETFVKNVSMREKQMQELKEIFKGIL